MHGDFMDCEISVGFSEKKQGIHDIVAKTYVVPN